MTQAIRSLVKAIRELESAGERYSQAIREGKKPSSELYVSIIRDAWRNYLKAGGSLSMDNPQVPPHLDFNAKGKLQVMQSVRKP